MEWISQNPALIPALVSAFAAIISSYVAASARLSACRADMHHKVSAALEALVAPDIVKARNCIGAAARSEQMDTVARESFIDAAFRIMWAIQRTDFAIKAISRTRLAASEEKWLLRQLNIIIKDLNLALSKHGANIDWNPTIDHTNEVLGALSRKIETGRRKTGIDKKLPSFELKITETHPPTAKSIPPQDGASNKDLTDHTTASG